MKFFEQNDQLLIWRNVDTGEILQGGETRTVAAPLDVIPAFERTE